MLQVLILFHWRSINLLIPHVFRSGTKLKDSEEFEKAEVIFHIPLNNPQDIEYTIKPSAERMNNFVCTLYMEKIPIASARADGNWAYIRRSNASQYYCFKNGDLNGKYYIKCRDISAATSKPVYVHEYVELSTIYTLTRYYRCSKSDNFFNMSAKIKCMGNRIPCPNYYSYLNRWIGR